jgi:AhpD family alkylhydroperoxidase
MTITNETTQIPVRLDFDALASDFSRAMAHLDRAATKELDKAGIDPRLRELIRIRASQLNGCAYCIDMHTKDARAIGETEQRIYGLAAWQETPYFTPRERAALAFTEVVTRLSDTHVPDRAYQDVAAEFSPQEIAALVSLIVAINAWNAISVSTRAWIPGSYTPLRAQRGGRPAAGPGSAGQRGGVRTPTRLQRVAGQLGTAARPAERRPGVGVGQVGGGLREHTEEDTPAHIARRVEATAEALRYVVAVQERLVAAERGKTLWVGHSGRVKGAHVWRRGAYHRGQDPAACHRELQYFGWGCILLGSGNGPYIPRGGLHRKLPGVGQQAIADVFGGMPAVPLQRACRHRPVPVRNRQQPAHHAGNSIV